MNRLLILLVLAIFGSALPVAAVAEGERGATGVTNLILIFFSDVSRGLFPKRVVNEDKDWKIVKEAQQAQEDRKSHEERRREAFQRLEEQEREARKAREEYRRETRNALYERQFAWRQPADEREARAAQEERLRAAERRLREREREAEKAKMEYQYAARMAREERHREAEKPRVGG
jgi:hypothetical protein